MSRLGRAFLDTLAAHSKDGNDLNFAEPGGVFALPAEYDDQISLMFYRKFSNGAGIAEVQSPLSLWKKDNPCHTISSG